MLNKEIIRWGYAFSILFVIMIAILCKVNDHYQKERVITNETIQMYQDSLNYLISSQIEEKHAKIEDWEMFITALAWVESQWSENAVGKTGDLGYLQLTSIAVNDANRISGKNFTLEDRLSKEKSIDMFNIIQEEYNPDKSFHLALKIHNPLAPVGYHRKIMRKYHELR